MDFSASALWVFKLTRTRQSKNHNFCSGHYATSLRSASQAAVARSGGLPDRAAAIALVAFEWRSPPKAIQAA